MRCSYWLSGTLVLLFAILAQSQGQEACYNVIWTYHSHTHTCFRVFRTGMLWTDARDYCRDRVQAGSDYGVTTQLAKIDDKNTNDFVRKLLPEVNWAFWIGLYYNNDKNSFRWDGYPDEKPKFRDSNWEEQSEPYVSLFSGGWRGKDSTQNYHYMCQQSAKRIIGDVTCEHHVVANGFNITCTSKRNPIQAKCQWTYKYDADQVPQDWTSVATLSHESVEEDEVTFYTTSCKTILSNVQPGYVAFQMKMYPDITQVDLETNQKAWTVGWMNLSVALPNQPLFKTRDKTLLTTSPVHFHENNTMNLSCEVTSGKPFVYSVNLSCEFPFKNSDVNNMDTQIGTAYVIDTIASRDMNGKNCTCIGNHLSGPIESSPLTFNVTYPVEVKIFTVNGNESFVEVDLNMTLTLSCLADGNPLPSVNIRKLEPSYLDTSAWLAGDSWGEVVTVLEARCDHNGKYQCSAQNAWSNQEERRDLDIRVRCQPTYCNEASRDLQMVVQLGRSQTVSLCVVAYPMPGLKLLKNSNAGWIEPEGFGEGITSVTSFDSQQNVNISIPVLGPSHLGQYSLEYSHGSGTNSSMLYFNLTAPLTPCNGGDSAVQVKLEQQATITLCVTAFPAPSSLVMQIERDSEWHDYTNSTITLGVDFDTLTNVMVFFPRVTDLGQYRLFDPLDDDESVFYVQYTLSEDKAGGGGGGSGAVVGAVVAVVIVIIIVVVVVIFILRRRRTRAPKEDRPASEAMDNKTYYRREDYATVNLSAKRTRPKEPVKTDSQIAVYDNEGFLFEHRSSKDYDDEKLTEDTERSYCNVVVQSNPLDDKTPESKSPESKTPESKAPESKTPESEDDLVYIQLNFNVTSDKKAKPKKRSKPKKKPKKSEEAREEDGEETEYSAISATATIKIRKEKEEEEARGKEDVGNNEKEGGEEEVVYENMTAGDNKP